MFEHSATHSHILPLAPSHSSCQNGWLHISTYDRRVYTCYWASDHTHRTDEMAADAVVGAEADEHRENATRPDHNTYRDDGDDYSFRVPMTAVESRRMLSQPCRSLFLFFSPQSATQQQRRWPPARSARVDDFDRQYRKRRCGLGREGGKGRSANDHGLGNGTSRFNFSSQPQSRWR